MMAWNTIQSSDPALTADIFNDVVHTQSWGLLHQAGSVTYPHHNTAGQHIWVLNMAGYKFWIIFKIKDNAREDYNRNPNDLNINIFQGEYNLASVASEERRDHFRRHLPWEEDYDTELVVLGPGQML